MAVILLYKKVPDVQFVQQNGKAFVHIVSEVIENVLGGVHKGLVSIFESA